MSAILLVVVAVCPVLCVAQMQLQAIPVQLVQVATEPESAVFARSSRHAAGPILLNTRTPSYLGSRGKRYSSGPTAYDVMLLDSHAYGKRSATLLGSRGRRSPFLGSRGRRSPFLGSRGRRSAFLGSRGRRATLPMLLPWEVDYRPGEGQLMPAFVLDDDRPFDKRSARQQQQPITLILQ